MKKFVMGAELKMKDDFSSGISSATKASKIFKSNIDSVNKSLETHIDKNGKVRDAHGKFVKSGDAASLRTRAWVGANGKLGASFSLVARGVIATAAAFAAWKAKSWLIDSNADMETYRQTLNIVMKDEKKAGQTLEWATKFAAQTPFEIPAVVEATTRLTTYGFQAQKVTGIVGDMASVMGKDLMQAVEAVADAQTGEVERLKEFGITKQMLVDKAKKMNLKIVDKQGSITDMKAFNATLFALMEARFKGGMAAQSKTFKGMLSNAKDFIGSIGRTLGKPIFDRLKVQMEKVMKWAQKVQDSGIFDKWAKTIGTNLDKIEAYFSRFSSDSKFKNMSLAEKFIYVLKDMLTKANNYMQGPGGDQVKSVFKIITKTLIEVLQGAFTELMPIATAIGTQIGTAIVAGVGTAIADKMKDPVNRLNTGITSMGKDIVSNPGKVMNPDNGSLGLIKRLFHVGKNATGTNSWRGGPTWVGERGPELMNVPRGTSITSNYESMQKVNPAGHVRNSSAGKSVQINSLVGKIEINGANMDNQELLAQIMEKMGELMRQAKELAGSADMGALLPG